MRESGLAVRGSDGLPPEISRRISFPTGAVRRLTQPVNSQAEVIIAKLFFYPAINQRSSSKYGRGLGRPESCASSDCWSRERRCKIEQERGEQKRVLGPIMEMGEKRGRERWRGGRSQLTVKALRGLWERGG